jgi:hypothetical protein
MDDIPDHTLYALVNRRGSTLLDIPRFLSRENPAFRNEVLRTADKRVRTFFTETYPSMDRNAASPIISRINAFTRREAIRNLLCQPGNSFNFRHAMDEAKILLFNLSDGILGEQSSQLLGQIIGPDHGTGHFAPSGSIPRLAVVDSTVLEVDQRIAKSRQTSNAVSD